MHWWEVPEATYPGALRSDPGHRPTLGDSVPRTFTVFGLYIEDAALVAAVVSGEHPAVDDDPASHGRWSTAVLAADPADAEVLAAAGMQAAYDERNNPTAPSS